MGIMDEGKRLACWSEIYRKEIFVSCLEDSYESTLEISLYTYIVEMLVQLPK